jgi:hypothetical protein
MKHLPSLRLVGEGVPGNAPGPGGRRLKPLVMTHGTLGLATGAAILCRGYDFAKADQSLYLPFVLKWNDPSLFPHDLLLRQGFAKLSGTWVGVSLLARVVDLETLCLLLYILASYLVLWLTYRTALAWWGDRSSARLAVVLWIPTFRVPGVANDTFDNYFTHRLVGTIFGMVIIGAVLQHRQITGGIGAFLGGLGHLISVVPVTGGGALAALARRRWALAAWLAGGLTLAVLSLLVLRGGIPGEWRYAGPWREAVVLADSELFPHLWLSGFWPDVATYGTAFFGLYAWRRRMGVARSAEDDAFFMGVGLLLASALGWLGSALFLVPIVQLCLFRGVLFLMWLLALYLAGVLVPLLRDGRWPVVLAAAWVAGSWLSGHLSLAVLGLPVFALAATWTPLRACAGKLLAGRRGALVLFLGLAVVIWGEDLLFVLFGFNAGEWFRWKGAELFALAFTFVLTPLLLIRTKRFQVPLPLALSAALALAVVLVPPQALVAWVPLPSGAGFKPFYGSRIGLGLVKRAARVRESTHRAAMAALVRESVPKDSTVLVPPDWQAFRVTALRSPYVTLKDGALSEFDRAYAEEWSRRLLAVRGARRKQDRLVLDPAAELTDAEMLALGRQEVGLHLDYAVTARECALPLVGSAGGLWLYRLASNAGPAGPTAAPGGHP